MPEDKVERWKEILQALDRSGLGPPVHHDEQPFTALLKSPHLLGSPEAMRRLFDDVRESSPNRDQRNEALRERAAEEQMDPEERATRDAVIRAVRNALERGVPAERINEFLEALQNGDDAAAARLAREIFDFPEE